MHSLHTANSHAIAVNPKYLVFLAILFLLAGTLLCVPAIADGDEHPTLAIGSPAPDFCLPGVDGQTHCLKEYAASKVLVIAFICNHCPTAQLYETRIKQIAADYKDKRVAVVAIEPNNPDAVLLNEMGYTDVGDSLEDMKTGRNSGTSIFHICTTERPRKSLPLTGPPPRRISSFLIPTASFVTKAEWTTTCASRWSLAGRTGSSRCAAGRKVGCDREDSLRGLLDEMALQGSWPARRDGNHREEAGCPEAGERRQISRSFEKTLPANCCWWISGRHGVARAAPNCRSSKPCTGCMDTGRSTWSR